MPKIKWCAKELQSLLTSGDAASSPEQISHIVEYINMMRHILADEPHTVAEFLELETPGWPVRNFYVLMACIRLYTALIKDYQVDPSLLDMGPLLTTTLAGFQAQLEHVKFLVSLTGYEHHDKRLIYALISYIYHPGVVGELAWQGVLSLSTQYWIQPLDLGQYLASGLGAFIAQNRESKRRFRSGSIASSSRHGLAEPLENIGGANAAGASVDTNNSDTIDTDTDNNNDNFENTGTGDSLHTVEEDFLVSPPMETLTKHLSNWNKLVACNKAFIDDFERVFVDPILFETKEQQQHNNPGTTPSSSYGSNYDLETIGKVLRCLKPPLADIVIRKLDLESITPTNPPDQVCDALSVIYAAISTSFECSKEYLMQTVNVRTPDYQSLLTMFRTDCSSNLSYSEIMGYYQELHLVTTQPPTTQVQKGDHILGYLEYLLENSHDYPEGVLCWLTLIFRELVVQGCTLSGALGPVMTLLEQGADSSRLIKHHLCELETLVVNSLCN